MIAKRFSEGNMKSASQQANDDKEAVMRLNDSQVEPNDSEYVECGLDNPCVFGKWNPKAVGCAV